MTTIAGVVGNAMAFSGSDDPISQIEVLNFDTTGLKTMTIAFWMRPDAGTVATPNFKRIISGGDNFEAILNADTGAWATTFIAQGGAYPITDPPQEEVWIHVAMTSDLTPPGTGNMQTYVNGVLKIESDASQLAINDYAGGTLLFGARPNSVARFQGALDDIRIYDTILTAQEINPH